VPGLPTAGRLGVLGGTFDPIHSGHLLLARGILERLSLDRVLFVPAADPPHKSGTHAGADHRLAMVRLAVDGLPDFAVSTVEMERDGPSYTVDTLRQLRAEYGDSELFLIIGADNVSDLPTWVDPEGILALATVVAGSRAVSAAGDGPLAGRIERVDTPAFDISSTEIRRRRAAGLSLRCLVPDAVERYILDHHLYGSPS
jgi:nicotinate-nucleotide adenylyltransferase